MLYSTKVITASGNLMLNICDPELIDKTVQEGNWEFGKLLKLNDVCNELAIQMYYELTKSLKEMNKIPEACRTFELLEKNYKGNKYTKMATGS